MAKIISSSYLNRKLTSDKLRNKVGNIKINCDDKIPKNLGGVALKKFIVSKMGGKTDTRIEKILKEYGVSDNQIDKRNRIMRLIKGDEKVSLTKEQTEKNLLRSRPQGESGRRVRQLYNTQYASSTVQTMSLGAITDKPAPGGWRIRGTMADLNIKRKSTGFAQKFNEAKPTGNPPPQAPLKGSKPIGL